jgi:hypothetical protein
MIDLSTERLCTFLQAAKTLPGHVHLSTLHRWRLRGIRGIKLETILVGGKRLTSAEALQRFAQRTTALAHGEPVADTPAGRTAAQRHRDIERAERELEAERA